MVQKGFLPAHPGPNPSLTRLSRAAGRSDTFLIPLWGRLSHLKSLAGVMWPWSSERKDSLRQGGMSRFQFNFDWFVGLILVWKVEMKLANNLMPPENSRLWLIKHYFYPFFPFLDSGLNICDPKTPHVAPARLLAFPYHRANEARLLACQGVWPTGPLVTDWALT